MKKVVVVGSGGAGKSTFSRRLGEITGLEVIHLDSVYWRPNWTEPPKDAWAATVARLIQRDSWIMDGNFGGTRELRMRAADTIIFLDLPRRLCLYRGAKRAILYYGRRRPDMAGGCNERLDREFLLWIWNYPKTSRVRLLAELEKLPNKRIVVLRSRADVRKFLLDLEQQVKHGS